MIDESTLLIMTGVFALAQVLLFGFVSYCERNFVNFYLFHFLIGLPTHYIFPFFRLYKFGAMGGLQSYLIVYATLFLMSIGFITSFYAFRRLSVRTFPTSCHSVSAWFPFIALGIGATLFMPILIEFRHLLTSPTALLFDSRELYRTTRQGYGLLFFGAELFLLLSVVLMLFSEGKRYRILFVLAAIGLGLLMGSKRNLITILMIFLLHSAYVRNVRFGSRRFAAIAGGVIFMMTAFFYFASFSTSVTSRRASEQVELLIDRMAHYSDFIDNPVMVVEKIATRNATHGRILAEQVILGRTPRQIFPNKPALFGTRRIAAEFYPEKVDEAHFSPSFGIGIEFRDFGYIAIPLLVAASCLSGLCLRAFLSQVITKGDLGSFIMFLYFCGLPILGIGGVSFLWIEHYVLGLMLNMVGIFRFNIFKKAP